MKVRPCTGEAFWSTTHTSPSGVDSTRGTRSFRCAGASRSQRSGGGFTWESAEMSLTDMVGALPRARTAGQASYLCPSRNSEQQPARPQLTGQLVVNARCPVDAVIWVDVDSRVHRRHKLAGNPGDQDRIVFRVRLLRDAAELRDARHPAVPGRTIVDIKEAVRLCLRLAARDRLVECAE